MFTVFTARHHVRRWGDRNRRHGAGFFYKCFLVGQDVEGGNLATPAKEGGRILSSNADGDGGEQIKGRPQVTQYPSLERLLSGVENRTCE